MLVNQEKMGIIDPKILTHAPTVKEKIAKGSSIPALFSAKSGIWLRGVALRIENRGIIFIGKGNFLPASIGKVNIVPVSAAPNGAADFHFARSLPRSAPGNGPLFISSV